MQPYNPYLQAYMQSLQQFLPQQQTPQMSMPTIHADIIQVSSLEAVERYSVGVGQSQMFITQDEAEIFVKSGTESGPTLTVYDKRPPTPPAPAFDPQTYVTKDELEARLRALTEVEK